MLQGEDEAAIDIARVSRIIARNLVVRVNAARVATAIASGDGVLVSLVLIHIRKSCDQERNVHDA